MEHTFKIEKELKITTWQLPNGKIEYIRELAEGEEAVKFGRAAGY